MKKNLIAAIAFTAGVTVLSFGHVSAATTAGQIIKKSDTAITSRINSLNKLSTKLNALKHLTADQKTSLTGTIQTSIASLTTLKSKIDAETDIATLKTDYASITADYRIYALVLPTTVDIAVTDTAAGKITTDQTTLNSLQTRITDAATVGKSSNTMQSYHDDAVAKLTDAQTQVQALVTAIASLKPDMGNKTLQASNKTAIAAAKVDHKTLLTDLAAAQKDITAIRSGLSTLKA